MSAKKNFKNAYSIYDIYDISNATSITIDKKIFINVHHIQRRRLITIWIQMSNLNILILCSIFDIPKMSSNIIFECDILEDNKEQKYVKKKQNVQIQYTETRNALVYEQMQTQTILFSGILLNKIQNIHRIITKNKATKQTNQTKKYQHCK